MKTIITTTIILISQLAVAQVVPIELANKNTEIEYREQIIHDKEINLSGENLKFKWTTVGYGSLTYKVIIPELAAHTLLNHRNFGEEGPCLRSDRQAPFPNFEFKTTETTTPTETTLQSKPEEVLILIRAVNLYTISHEENTCDVSLIERVSTTINGESFYHEVYKSIGKRHIDDCLVEQ